MEMSSGVAAQSEEKKNGGLFAFVLSFLSISILLGVLCFGIYHFFIKPRFQTSAKSEVAVSSAEYLQQSDMEQRIFELSQEIEEKKQEISILQKENQLLKEQANSTIEKLQYVLKPKTAVVAECYDASVGKYGLSKKCGTTLVANLKKLLAQNKKVVALEVIGVVDELKYRGPGAGLKQEGLASFRAKEAFKYLKKTLPNMSIFQGLSIQKKNKRGFFIRAYVLQ